MNAHVYDLAARRAARTRDSGVVLEDLKSGAESLLAVVSSWPCVPLRESHLIGAERTLTALQALLYELRGFVSTQGGPPDAG